MLVFKATGRKPVNSFGYPTSLQVQEKRRRGGQKERRRVGEEDETKKEQRNELN